MESIVVQIGLLLIAAATLAVIFKFLKQPSIFAFIIVGILAHSIGGTVHMPHEMIEIFTEIGIILLLFMAGLEVDINSFVKRWKLVLINGLGQILLTTAAGFVLGLSLLKISSVSACIFFGLCLTFSSTIIVLAALKERKEMESFHGQIILGLMVLQDIVAVLALSVLNSMGGDTSFVIEILFIFFKMLLLIVLLKLIAKYFLKRLFRFLAKSAEMLFLGALGYSLGIAAFCELVHFSPEIGAFLAGISLSILPYKLEIEDKVEPLKTFGVILFFIALGYKLEFSRDILTIIIPIIISIIVVVFGKPLIMLFLGWITKAKSRPTFLIGGTINQISEFSLILATLCLKKGVFNNDIFLIVTLSCLGTIFLSCLGHQVLNPIYRFFRKPLKYIDSHSRSLILEEGLEFKLENHVILLSYNELTESIYKYYNELNKTILIIDIDPEIHEALVKRENVKVAYADMYDPDVWEEFNFDKASLIISCMIRGQEAEKGISRWLLEHNSDVPFIAATDSTAEAIELYETGVRFVIQTEDLAAREFKKIFECEMHRGKDAFKELGVDHYKKIKDTEFLNKFVLYRL